MGPSPGRGVVQYTTTLQSSVRTGGTRRVGCAISDNSIYMLVDQSPVE